MEVVVVVVVRAPWSVSLKDPPVSSSSELGLQMNSMSTHLALYNGSGESSSGAILTYQSFC